MKHNFYIKEGYQINEIVHTMDDQSGGEYWNPLRLKNSELYQYYVYKYALRLMKRKKLKTVIDVGCGSGLKLKMIHKALPDAKIIGIDQKGGIDFCKKNLDFGEFVVDDFENAQQQNMNGDLIICADVIEHLENPDLLFDYFKANLKENGYLVLSTPERDSLHGLKNNQPTNKFHIREWNKAELATYVESNGFKVIDHKLQYPIRLGNNHLMKNEIYARFKLNKKLKFNQVILAQLK